MCIYIINYYFYQSPCPCWHFVIKYIGGYDYKNMDNNQTWQAEAKGQEMQNWKKKLLMDPILNNLLDQSLPVNEFLQSKISTVPKSQIPHLFTKLTTINHELSQSIQKQVQNKGPEIEKSFTELLSYKQQLQNQDNGELSSLSSNKSTEYLTHLKLFNSKYETVQKSIVEWTNIREILKFAKALETFKVNVSIMKTLMRGFNGNQDSINCIKIAKMLKDIITLSTTFDFSGIKSFEGQRVFISSTKSIVYSKGCKVLPVFLQQYANITIQTQKSQKQSLQKNIEDWLNALSNISLLKDFIVSFGKYMLNEQLQSIKKSMKNDFIHIQSNIENVLAPFIFQSCKSLIFLQEKLVLLRKVELSNVPNLFIRYWQKLCENIKENISYAKKQQQKLKIKGKQDEFVWKYPCFYYTFANLCQNIQAYLFKTALYNNYGFSKSKQKLMISCLIQHSLQYHTELQKQLSIMTTFLSYRVQPQQNPNSTIEPSVESAFLVPVKKWVQSLQRIIETSKSKEILSQIFHNLYKKLRILNEQVQIQNYKQEEMETRKQHVFICNFIKKQIKKLLQKYGSQIGIQRSSLEVFKIVK